MPGRLDPLLGFLLKCMDNPDVLVELHGVEQAECSSAERQRNLKHPRAHPVRGLGDVRLSAFRHDGQRRQANRPGALRESLEDFQRSSNSGNGPGSRYHRSSRFILPSHVVISDNGCQLVGALCREHCPHGREAGEEILAAGVNLKPGVIARELIHGRGNGRTNLRTLTTFSCGRKFMKTWCPQRRTRATWCGCRASRERGEIQKKSAH